jgi:hypothetical protein
LAPGQRPGPYTAVIATGPQRGQSYCYVCETADRPAVVVFARRLSDPLARLTGRLDRALGEHSDLRAWVTFLNDDQPSFDKEVVRWARRHAIQRVPLGVYEDAGGPPTYRVARDADVTVLLFVKRQIAANFAFREGELTDAAVGELMKALPRITGGKAASGRPPRADR